MSTYSIPGSQAGLLYIMMIPNECLKVEIADRAGCEATIAARIGADEGALTAGWQIRLNRRFNRF